MLIGIDFDNTIADYNSLFYRVARERGLIPSNFFLTDKNAIRDYLHQERKEREWADMQGYIYGKRMGEVKPFPGFFDFLDLCCREKIGVYIISFKTRYPFEGERYDLHEAAFDWMKENRVYPPENSQSAIAGVFFEPTRIMKIQRIIALGCTHFIDDLPEILFHPEFPHYIKKILFDPDNLHRSYPEFRKMRSWHEIIALFEEKELRKGGS